MGFVRCWTKCSVPVRHHSKSFDIQLKWSTRNHILKFDPPLVNIIICIFELFIRQLKMWIVTFFKIHFLSLDFLTVHLGLWLGVILTFLLGVKSLSSAFADPRDVSPNSEECGNRIKLSWYTDGTVARFSGSDRSTRIPDHISSDSIDYSGVNVLTRVNECCK